MIIEHTFITTLKSHEALSKASEFLGAAGFVARQQSAFALDSAGWTELEMVRGKPGMIDPLNCLQQIRIHYDRGRVDIAASISPSARRSGRFALSSAEVADVKPTSKFGRPYALLMIAAAQALEDLLARGVAADQAARPWREQELALSQKIRKRSRRQRIISGAILVIVAVAFGFLLFIMLRR